MAFSQVISNLSDSRYINNIEIRGIRDGKVVLDYVCHPDEVNDYMQLLHHKDKINKMNLYISPNTFKNGKRKNARYSSRSIIAYNSIVCDIDNASWHERPEDSNVDVLEELLRTIIRDWDDSMPQIATIVKTGRGVQVWWMLEPASAKLKRQYADIKKALFSALDRIIRDYSDFDGFSIDANSYKEVQMMRFPVSGSFNIANSMPVTWQDVSDARYSIDEMMAMLGIEKTLDHKMKKINAIKKAKKTRKARKGKPQMSHATYAPYHMKMVHFIENLVKRNSHCNGRRNNMLMIYFCMNAQLYTIIDAESKTFALNDMFSEPLTNAEVTSVIKSCEQKNAWTRESKHGKKGIMNFAKKTVFRLIGATDSEKALYESSITTYKERDAIRKQERQVKKEQRDKKIASTFLKTHNKSETARICKVDRKTVRKVLIAYFKHVKATIVSQCKQFKTNATKKLTNFLARLTSSEGIITDAVIALAERILSTDDSHMDDLLMAMQV